MVLASFFFFDMATAEAIQYMQKNQAKKKNVCDKCIPIYTRISICNMCVLVDKVVWLLVSISVCVSRTLISIL